jgi:two-component system KDP operon response regulator KdpE
VKPRPKALIVDDELATRRLVRIVLETENYKVFEAADGRSGSRLAAERRPDVIILDPGLPDVSGAAWLQSFRESSQIPVLVLSVGGRITDKVEALDSGANDYLVKPFDTAELLARLRVLQRCFSGIPEESVLIEGDLQVNMAAHEVTLNDRLLMLTATEEAVFYVLAQHAGKVVTCNHLLRSIWGYDSKNKLHELQVLIARVRKKLEAAGNRVLIRTVGRIGYQLSRFEDTSELAKSP